MYKVLSALLLVAFCVGIGSAFTTEKNNASAPELMTSVELKQTASQTLTGLWAGSGPFNVTLINLTTNQVVANFQTNNVTQTWTGLAFKNTYRLNVSDENVMFDDETVSF